MNAIRLFNTDRSLCYIDNEFRLHCSLLESGQVGEITYYIFCEQSSLDHNCTDKEHNTWELPTYPGIVFGPVYLQARKDNAILNIGEDHDIILNYLTSSEDLDSTIEDDQREYENFDEEPTESDLDFIDDDID